LLGNLDVLGQVIVNLVLQNLDHFEVVSEKLIKLLEGVAETTRAADNEIYEQTLALLKSIWTTVSRSAIFLSLICEVVSYCLPPSCCE
jgi:hypothetical protein